MAFRVFLSLMFFFICSIYGFSKETSVAGVIPNGYKQEVRLISHADFISGKKLILAKDTIDKNGNFNLIFDLDYTISSSLEINYYNYELIVIPGENYFLGCDSILTKNIQRPFYNKEPLSGILIDSTRLNDNISFFNLLYNDWLINNFDQIYTKRKRSLIRAFEDSIKVQFSDVNIDYFKNHIKYRIASAELAAMPTAKSQLFGQLIEGQEILYHHKEYMYFFKQLFDNYLGENSGKVGRNDFITTINYQKNASALLDSLGKDSLLQNEKIRELVMLKTLREMYFHPDFIGPNVINMLAQVKANSPFDQHKEIAANLISELIKLSKDSQGPDFNLPDLKGEKHTLIEYLGKPLYLSFITTWSYGCLYEMELLKGLHVQFGDQINFVSIALDDNIEIVKSLVMEKGYSWPFLYSGVNYQIINNFNIMTFPLFVLLDEEGFIIQFPAPKPSDNTEAFFQRFLSQE
jgi:thiol-disulfide isomerase/thioredoxin